MIANLYVAWIGFFLGCLSGAVPELFFYRKDWLGGYSSGCRVLFALLTLRIASGVTTIYPMPPCLHSSCSTCPNTIA